MTSYHLPIHGCFQCLWMLGLYPLLHPRWVNLTVLISTSLISTLLLRKVYNLFPHGHLGGGWASVRLLLQLTIKGAGFLPGLGGLSITCQTCDRATQTPCHHSAPYCAWLQAWGMPVVSSCMCHPHLLQLLGTEGALISIPYLLAHHLVLWPQKPFE